MYTFVNVPDISVTEWHPFSASLPLSLDSCLSHLLSAFAPSPAYHPGKGRRERGGGGRSDLQGTMNLI